MITLVRHIATLRPGDITSPTVSAKTDLLAIARRWLVLHEEIQIQEKELVRMVRDKAPDLMNIKRYILREIFNAICRPKSPPIAT